jgi:hypothetical protein
MPRRRPPPPTYFQHRQQSDAPLYLEEVVSLVQDPLYRLTHPSDCARRCQSLAETAYEPYRGYWYSQAAQAFVLANNWNAASFCVRTFLNRNLEHAIIHAQDSKIRDEHPAYGTKIYQLLAEQRGIQVAYVGYLYSQAAQLYARTPNREALTLRTEEFVMSNCLEAISQAKDVTLQIENPAYCAELCAVLTTKNVPEDYPGYWESQAAQLFALSMNPQGLTVRAIAFVKLNPGLAREHAQNTELRRKNPWYCAQLCSVIAPHRTAEYYRGYWEREAAQLYTLAGNSLARNACLKNFAYENPQQAAEDAYNTQLQQSDPGWCLTILRCRLPPSDQHLIAQLYALTESDPTRVKEHIQLLITSHRQHALDDTQDIKLQETNPAYCAALFAAFSDDSSLELKMRWLFHSQSAQLYARLSTPDPLIPYQVENLIRLDREKTIAHTQDSGLRKKNPTYCAILCTSLAQTDAPIPYLGYWTSEAAKLYALSRDRQQLATNISLFMRLNPSTACAHVDDPVLRKENPLYCAEIEAHRRMGSQLTFPDDLPLPNTWILHLLTRTSESDTFIAILITAFKRVVDERTPQEIQVLTDFLKQNWPQTRATELNNYLTRIMTTLIAGELAREKYEVVFPLLQFFQAFIRSLCVDEISVFKTPFQIKHSNGNVTDYTPLNLMLTSLFWEWPKMQDNIKSALLFTIKMILNHADEMAMTTGVYLDNRLIDTPLHLLYRTLVEYYNSSSDEIQLALLDLLSAILRHIPYHTLDEAKLLGVSFFSFFKALDGFFDNHAVCVPDNARLPKRDRLLIRLGFFTDINILGRIADNMLPQQPTLHQS